MSERKIDDRELQEISGAGGQQELMKEAAANDSGSTEITRDGTDGGGSNTGTDTSAGTGSGNTNIGQG